MRTLINDDDQDKKGKKNHLAHNTLYTDVVNFFLKKYFYAKIHYIAVIVCC